jgi:hypothetical protein
MIPNIQKRNRILATKATIPNIQMRNCIPDTKATIPSIQKRDKIQMNQIKRNFYKITKYVVYIK